MFVPLDISKINWVFLLLYLWHPFGSSQSLRKSRTQPKWFSVRHPEKYGASGLRAVSTFLDVRFCFVILSSWWRFGHLQMFWNFPGLFCTFLYQFQVEWNRYNSTEFGGSSNQAQTVSGKNQYLLVSLYDILTSKETARRILSKENVLEDVSDLRVMLFDHMWYLLKLIHLTQSMMIMAMVNLITRSR